MAAPRETSPEPNRSHHTTLYILIPPSALFAAHWSLFLSDYGPYNSISKRHEELPTGRRIHVSGDRLHGFTLEIIRGYDISKHRAVGSRRFPIGRVPSPYLVPRTADDSAREEEGRRTRKDSDEGGGFVSNAPIDAFEEVCVSVPAPGPSLNRVVGEGGSSGDGKARRKAEVRDCQWWVRQVVAGLLEKEMLEPLLPARSGEEMKGPGEIVEGLPVH